MDYYFVGWCSMSRAHPILLSYPPPFVLESAFDFIMRGPEIKDGVVKSPPSFKRGDELEASLRRNILEPMSKVSAPLFIDSGAYTIQAYAGARVAVTESGINFRLKSDVNYAQKRSAYEHFFEQPKNVERYLDLYTNEVMPILWDRVTVFAELDIQVIVGPKAVSAQRYRMLKQGVASKVLITWKEHLDSELMSADTFYEVARDWPGQYVALEMHNKKDQASLTADFYEVGVRAHGFGDADPDRAFVCPHYSVDSTRWKAPVCWGEVTRWIPHERRLWHIPVSPRKQAWAKFVAKGNHPVLDLGLPTSETKEGRDRLLVIQSQYLLDYSRAVTDWWKRKGFDYSPNAWEVGRGPVHESDGRDSA